MQDIIFVRNKSAILGNFNIDNLNLKSTRTTSYLNMLQGNAFHCIVDKPTRVRATSRT